MRTLKLTLEYDGTHYAGWQSQANALAIQDVVALAIEKMVEEKVTLHGASRTDSGVHALAQIAMFQTEKTIPCNGFLKGLNTLLPEDIRVKKCEEVADNFHPIRNATSKEYHYLLELGCAPSALNRHRAWWVGPDLDLEAMQAASRFLIGEHDFKSFQGPMADTKTTVRTLDSITPLLCKEGAGGGRPGVCLSFIGNGFLKYMIRNIVGTLVEVGQKKRAVKEVKEILESCDRRKAGIMAPPHGLYLVRIEYD